MFWGFEGYHELSLGGSIAMADSLECFAEAGWDDE